MHTGTLASLLIVTVLTNPGADFQHADLELTNILSSKYFWLISQHQQNSFTIYSSQQLLATTPWSILRYCPTTFQWCTVQSDRITSEATFHLKWFTEEFWSCSHPLHLSSVNKTRLSKLYLIYTIKPLPSDPTKIIVYYPEFLKKLN